MEKTVKELEQLAHLLKNSNDEKAIREAIQSLRDRVGAIHELPLRNELDHELEIWQSKLAVILEEPVGRQGMAKHAEYWIEKLKNV